MPDSPTESRALFTLCAAALLLVPMSAAGGTSALATVPAGFVATVGATHPLPFNTRPL